MLIITVYCDAGPLHRPKSDRGYNGPLRCGAVLLVEGGTVAAHVQMRDGTIAQGEAWAVQLGVAEALGRGAVQLHVRTDCQSTALAFQGRARVRNRQTRAVIGWVRDQLSVLPGSTVHWIPRSKNRAAHRLVQ